MVSFLVASSVLFSATVGGVRVEITPSNPGPYSGGEQFTLSFQLRNEMGVDLWLSVVRFDFQASNPIPLGPQFTFDFSAVEDGGPGGYFIQPDLPRPQIEDHRLGDSYLYLPAGGVIPIGTLPIQLPSANGTYRVDALNAGATQLEYGARIETWGAGELTARDGEIVGGYRDFTIQAVPAISTWGLVIVALFMAASGTLIIRRIGLCPFVAVWGLLVVFPCGANGQEATIEADIAELSIDSGNVSASGSGSEPVVVYSHSITITDAPWIRLHFSTVVLSGSPATQNGSLLRITSAQDQFYQILDQQGVVSWANTSAYMRGDEVLLELLAFRNTGTNRVAVDMANFGVESE